MISTYLGKQEVLNSDSKAIQQMEVTRNLEQVENTSMFFIIKEAKETILDFSQETVKVLWIYFALI